MRLTLLQINMVHLTGKQLPIDGETNTLQAQAKRILAARDKLVQATGQDFGYDVLQWYQYLTSLQVPKDIADEYTWADLHQQFVDWKPNSVWLLAVEEAKRLALEFPNCPRCGSFASLRRISHESPGAKEEMWLCNFCKMRIPISQMSDRDVENSP